VNFNARLIGLLLELGVQRGLDDGLDVTRGENCALVAMIGCAAALGYVLCAGSAQGVSPVWFTFGIFLDSRHLWVPFARVPFWPILWPFIFNVLPGKMNVQKTACRHWRWRWRVAINS
jgi:hypothetical protein